MEKIRETRARINGGGLRFSRVFSWTEALTPKGRRICATSVIDSCVLSLIGAER
jgi:hypothetical protein